MEGVLRKRHLKEEEAAVNGVERYLSGKDPGERVSKEELYRAFEDRDYFIRTDNRRDYHTRVRDRDDYRDLYYERDEAFDKLIQVEKERAKRIPDPNKQWRTRVTEEDIGRIRTYLENRADIGSNYNTALDVAHDDALYEALKKFEEVYVREEMLDRTEQGSGRWSDYTLAATEGTYPGKSS